VCQFLPDNNHTMSHINMYVIKRDGAKQPVSFDKVLMRIQNCSDKLAVNPALIAQKTLARIYNGVHTSELDDLAAVLAFSLSTVEGDYGILAGRIAISNHQKNTPNKFSTVVKILSEQTHPRTKEPFVVLDDKLIRIVSEHADEIDSYIKDERDFELDYFGFKTLERAYFLKDTDRKIVERPQHLWMRCAIGLWGNNLKEAFKTYDLLSQKFMTHATPTLFNAGTKRPQLSSCFLLGTEDSVHGIYKTISDCATISKYSGGIGVHISNIRAKNSLIHGTNGISTGIVPMLRVYNNTARYINQGGKRNGSFAMYLEPWHDDVEDFLKLKLNTGSEEDRARDLFYALWIPDLFMERVEADGEWSLFCPVEAPGLTDIWGDAFRALYEKYENEGRARRKVSAQKLWFKILDAQIETGTPYLLYKDAANRKSNQQNLGTIKSSNLCVAPETLILTRDGEVEIHSVAGKEVEVWNGIRWSKTEVTKTGCDQPVITVEVLVGNIYNETKGEYEFKLHTIECTHYHKFIIEDNKHDAQDRHLITSDKIANNLRVEAKDLKRGMTLVNWMDTEGRPVESIVWSIRDHGRMCDTYCFNEPELHAGVFNGVLTGNCSEIIEYSSSEESAVCNLASIVLPTFVEDGKINYEKLREVAGQAIRNLDQVIDVNFYPTPETELSNMRHRPVGLGIQGLADVLAMLRLPWESEKAAEVNQLIFEHMYYAAVKASYELAREKGSYSTFAGSPANKGQLQPDLWNVIPLTETDGSLDWKQLREEAAKGLRNSLLIAPMPTASTSQIMGSNECFEPFTSNIYTRRTLAGEFIIVNKYLMRDLVKYDLWSETMKQKIIAANGSVQNISEINQRLKDLYKTSWEIKQKTLIDMAAARGAFICQSQSLNLFVAEPTYSKLTSMHFYGWKKGLKTGMYYLRTKAPAAAQKFTIDPELLAAVEKDKEDRYKADEGCVMCSG